MICRCRNSAFSRRSVSSASALASLYAETSAAVWLGAVALWNASSLRLIASSHSSDQKGCLDFPPLPKGIVLLAAFMMVVVRRRSSCVTVRSCSVLHPAISSSTFRLYLSHVAFLNAKRPRPLLFGSSGAVGMVVIIGRWSDPMLLLVDHVAPLERLEESTVMSGADLPPVAGLSLVGVPSLRHDMLEVWIQSSIRFPWASSLWCGSQTCELAFTSPATIRLMSDNRLSGWNVCSCVPCPAVHLAGGE